MSSNYKYNPDDFVGMMSLPDDLSAFYNAYETCIKDNTERNRLFLERRAWDFFLSVKHRGLEGFFSQAFQGELWEYMMDLLEDAAGPALND